MLGSISFKSREMPYIDEIAKRIPNTIKEGYEFK